jgi:hypothetical protein
MGYVPRLEDYARIRSSNVILFTLPGPRVTSCFGRPAPQRRARRLSSPISAVSTPSPTTRIHDPGNQVRTGLSAGGEWIRNFSSALPLVVSRVSEIRDPGRAAGRIRVRFDALHGRELWIRLPVDRLRRLAQHTDLLSLKCRPGHPLHFKNDASVLSAPVMPMSSSRASEYSRCTMNTDAPRSPFAGMGDLSAALLCPRSDTLEEARCLSVFPTYSSRSNS